MAKNAYFVWNPQGYTELRKSAAIVKGLEDRAKAIATRSASQGVETEVDTKNYLRTPVTKIAAKGAESLARNAKNNTLLKSLAAGRG